MQVSLYLSEELVKKLDRLAKRERRSRSQVAESLLGSSIASAKDRGGLAELVGRWKDERSAEEIVAQIYGDRRSKRRTPSFSR
jgi:predicted transcriptional regulator